MATEKEILVNQLVSIFSRAYLASKLGMQYGGSRDIYGVLGYDKNITYRMCRDRHRRHDIAKAIIDKPVKATWKGNFEVFESDDENTTSFEKEFSVLCKRLKLKREFSRLDRLALLGKYAVLFLGFDGVTSNMDLIQPVEGKRKLLYIKPFSEEQAKISKYEENPANPRYGLPLLYTIEFSFPNGKQTSVQVDHSRIIHVTSDILESEIESDYYLEPVWNRLQDLDKLVGGSAEMFWRGARPGIHAKADKEYTITEKLEKELKEQITEFEHDLRRVLMTEGIDELKELTSQVTDPMSHVDVQLKMISAVTGIPLRILVGSERGELASTQDRNNWADFIQARREEYAENVIIRPFIDRCIEYEVLPEPKQEYSIVWESLYATSEKDKAEVGKIRSAALKEYTTNPIAESVVPPKAFFELFLGLSSDQIDYINQVLEKEMNEEE